MTGSRWFCGLFGVVTLVGVAVYVVNATEPQKLSRANVQGVTTDYINADYRKEEKSFDFHTAGIQKALQGDYSSAILDYDQALILSPQNPEIYYNRAVAHYSVGQPAKALQDFELALQIQPAMAEAYANRSVVRMEMGDKVGAVSDGNKAANLFEGQGEYGLASDIRNWLRQQSTVSNF